MSNRTFVILILLLVVGFSVPVIKNAASKPKEVKLGIQHKNQGEKHIAAGQKHEAYNSSPASSGPHYADNSAPAQWGVYTQELPAEVFIHNEEHGGVVITYKPDLLAGDLRKLQSLMAPPYSDKTFSPIKAIVTPRASNTHAIQLAAWTWTLDLDKYDAATIKKFYLQHVSQSPEPTGGPNNKPINQAVGQLGG